MKGKPTARKELKRIDSKSARAAENAALRGDHTKLVRNHTWKCDDRQPPLLEGAVMKQPQKKRKKQVEYCPKREELGEHKKRHYYIEKEEERVYFPIWSDGPLEKYMAKWKECMYCGHTAHRGRHRWW